MAAVYVGRHWSASKSKFKSGALHSIITVYVGLNSLISVALIPENTIEKF